MAHRHTHVGQVLEIKKMIIAVIFFFDLKPLRIIVCRQRQGLFSDHIQFIFYWYDGHFYLEESIAR